MKYRKPSAPVNVPGSDLLRCQRELHFYYGPGYGLKISSTEGEGTVMEVYMAKKINLITIQEQFYGLLIETYEGLPNNVMYELCRLNAELCKVKYKKKKFDKF